MIFLHIDGGQSHACNMVTHVVRHGQAGHLRVRLQGDPPPIQRRCTATLRSDHGDGSVIPLTLHTYEEADEAKGGGNVILAGGQGTQVVPPEGVDTRGALLVHQRRRDAGLHDFLSRVAHPRTYVLAMNLAEREIEAALSPGTCVLVRAGESEAIRASRAVAAMARGARTLVGQTRTLTDGAWKVLIFNPAETILPHALTLNEEDWERTVIEAAPTGDFVIRAKLRSDDAWSVLNDLIQAIEASVSINRAGRPPLNIPSWPMTVRLGDTALFAADVDTTFDLTTRGDSNNTTIRIRLVADPVCPSVVPDLSGVVVLAQIASGPSNEPHLIKVEPSDEGDEEALDRLPTWKSGDGEPIEALMAVPGNTRGDQAAFYSRWRAGDQVLLRLDDGRLPLVLGAPRRRLDDHEGDAGADVVLQGQKLLQIAQREGEKKRTTITLDGNGCADVIAPDRLKLNDGVTLVPNKMTIHHETAIERKVSIDGDVSITGGTTIAGELEVGQAGG